MSKRDNQSDHNNTAQSLEIEKAQQQLEFWQVFAKARIVVAKSAIWGIFFLILWMLRAFFPLIFLTFVFSFVSTSIARVLGRVLPKLGWRSRVVIVFSGFVLIMSLLVYISIPQVKNGIYELNQSARDLPNYWEKTVDPWLYERSEIYKRLVTREVEVPITEGTIFSSDATPDPAPESSADPMTGTLAAPQLKVVSEKISLWKNQDIRDFIDEFQMASLKDIPTVLTDVVTGITAVFSLLFLSMLFSFLIVLDLATLSREVRKLEETKLSEFYRETIGNIVKFGAVLGKVLEAQAVIALVNSILTAIGLSLFGLPNVLFLSLMVFVCGFIPVVGVFISSVPICLVGLILGGVPTLLMLVAFITGIHFLEAYVLNPRIMGAALHINPVLVLIILVIGHHALGVWGLLLGLPICYYFFSHVIKRETFEIGLRAKFKKRSQHQTEGPST